MVSESDINLLDAYLDDALSSSEVHALDARLSEEPELVSSLDALRAERKARAAAMAALTPSEREAEQFSDTVIASARHGVRMRFLMRGLKVGISLAACLVIGFSVGWVQRGHTLTAKKTPVPQILPQPPEIVLNKTGGAPASIGAAQFQIATLDDKGTVTGIKRFKKADDLRLFVEEIAGRNPGGPILATPGPKMAEPGSPRKMHHAEPGPAPTSRRSTTRPSSQR